MLSRYRLRLVTLADELGNVSEACRRTGMRLQTYHRLKRQMDQWGIEVLEAREPRRGCPERNPWPGVPHGKRHRRHLRVAVADANDADLA
ncbi:MAG: helix-turn-helix domain-containing protein [Solirubrobacteraceae bacterium]